MTRQAWIIILLALIVPVAMTMGLLLGPVDLTIAAVFNALRGSLGLGQAGAGAESGTAAIIIMKLRLPRVLAAFVVGAGLSVVGVAMQALVRNPLAEPYILGISGGAAAGASLFYMGLLPPLALALLNVSTAAFAGALGTILLVYAVARTSEGLSVARLLLAGVAMASLMGAVSAFVTFASPDANRLRAVLFWLMGSFSGSSMSDLPLATVVTIASAGILWTLSRSLDALLLGEEPAHGLGVPVERVKHILIVIASLVTGVLVAISGAIGFVGLIVPHMVRGFVGVNHRYVLPASFLAGGTFLILADILSQIVLAGQQLPVGIVTSIAGVPFFLLLLRRSSHRFKNLS